MKSFLKWAYKNKGHIFYSVLVLFSVSVLIVTFIRSEKNVTRLTRSASQLHFEGEWSEDGRIGEGKFQEDIPPESSICINLYQVCIRIYQNGHLLYQYGYDEANAKTNVPERAWIQIDHVNIIEGDCIRIETEPMSQRLFQSSLKTMLNDIYLGNKNEVLVYQVSNYIVKILICIITAALGFLLMVGMLIVNRKNIMLKPGFISCGFLLFSGSICAFIDYEYINLIFSNTYMVMLIDYLSQVFICLFLMIYLKIYIANVRSRKIVNVCIAIWSFMTALYCLIYSILMREHRYLTEIFIITSVVFIIGEMILIFWEYRKQGRPEMKSVFPASIVLTILTLIEIVHYYLTNEFWIYIFQIGLFLFTIMQINSLIRMSLENIRKIEEQQRKLHENQIAIMMSQIQPHFLYNALNTIHYLCDEDPSLAAKTVENFAKYLRGNLDSISQRNPIPFEQEIEHLRKYLAIEQLRFDNVRIVYRLEAKGFVIPVLTIQPLVENAIKYGVTAKPQGGTVHIISREDDAYYYVLIEDDGVGFDVNAECSKERSHIGIQNTRERIEGMCNGTLTIHSQIGRGTSVQIKLPKRGGQSNESSSS